MSSRYEIKDLLAIKNKEKTLSEIAKKYGVKEETITKQMERNKIYRKKQRVRVISPFTNKIFDSMGEAAYELGVSTESVRLAANGKRVKVFEDLDITIERIDL